MGKHKAPRPPGPRHLTRLRLSLLVQMLEFERTNVTADERGIEPREWWTRREQLLIATGRREPA